MTAVPLAPLAPRRYYPPSAVMRQALKDLQHAAQTQARRGIPPQGLPPEFFNGNTLEALVGRGLVEIRDRMVHLTGAVEVALPGAQAARRAKGSALTFATPPKAARGRGRPRVRPEKWVPTRANRWPPAEMCREGWCTCILCENTFRPWRTRATIFSRLPEVLWDRNVCMPCFRRLVPAE